MSDQCVLVNSSSWRPGNEVEKHKLYDVVKMIESFEHTNPKVNLADVHSPFSSVKSLIL